MNAKCRQRTTTMWPSRTFEDMHVRNVCTSMLAYVCIVSICTSSSGAYEHTHIHFGWTSLLDNRLVPWCVAALRCRWRCDAMRRNAHMCQIRTQTDFPPNQSWLRNVRSTRATTPIPHKSIHSTTRRKRVRQLNTQYRRGIRIADECCMFVCTVVYCVVCGQADMQTHNSVFCVCVCLVEVRVRVAP